MTRSAVHAGPGPAALPDAANKGLRKRLCQAVVSLGHAQHVQFILRLQALMPVRSNPRNGACSGSQCAVLTPVYSEPASAAGAS